MSLITVGDLWHRQENSSSEDTDERMERIEETNYNNNFISNYGDPDYDRENKYNDDSDDSDASDEEITGVKKSQKTKKQKQKIVKDIDPDDMYCKTIDEEAYMPLCNH